MNLLSKIVICVPFFLAGTIFTGKKMGSDNLALVKKFSSVFARRIAASAHPDSCQQCECLANAEGIDFVDCIPCAIPVPAYTDFVINLIFFYTIVKIILFAVIIIVIKIMYIIGVSREWNALFLANVGAGQFLIKEMINQYLRGKLSCILSKKFQICK